MTLDTQFFTMLFMTAGGIYLGMARDTYTRFSLLWKKRKFFNYVMESSFWITQTFILFYVLFLVNGGELRLYIFLACLLGYAMYQVIAAKLYRKLLEFIIRIIMAVYHFFEKMVRILLIAPIKWIVQTLFACLLLIAGLLRTVLIFAGKCVYLPLKWIFQFIYRLLPANMQKILYKCAGVYSIIKNIYNKLVNFIKSKRR
jgi:spore cortex biosynthesis protein YabQ